MPIEYEMSWRELESLSGDFQLLPILRDRGMDVKMGLDRNGKLGIIANRGSFTWKDLPGRRIFCWVDADFELPVSSFRGFPSVPEPSRNIDEIQQRTAHERNGLKGIKATAIIDLYKRGMLSLNEAREQLGLTDDTFNYENEHQLLKAQIDKSTKDYSDGDTRDITFD